MARVKLKFPDENPLYTATISIRIGDINYGGHVGNDSILSIIHEARVQLLRSAGYSEMNAGSVSLIMADVMISYKGESFYGETLDVRIYADELDARSFDLLYHISTFRDGRKTDIAHAKTGMVCFDYQTRKIVLMSEDLRQFLTGQGSKS